MYIYIYLFIYIYINIYTYSILYLYLYIYIYRYVYTYMYQKPIELLKTPYTLQTLNTPHTIGIVLPSRPERIGEIAYIDNF